MKLGIVRRQLGAGGAEAAIARFASALVTAGHESVFYTAKAPARGFWNGTPPTVRIVPGSSPIRFADTLRDLDPRRECDLLFSFERVWTCDCYRAGDGVHDAWLARRAKYASRWKSVLRRAQSKHREILQLEKALFRPGALRAVIANSAMVKEEIIRHFDYPAGRIHVVYNGVPLQPVSDRAAARLALDIDPGRFVILFAGGGWERKGLRFAIDAVDRLSHSSPLLLVAGKGSLARYPRSSRVRYLGPVRDMANYLAAADVFLLPTIYDPFSNACLEAAAAGLPVITTAANGFSEIIRPGLEGEIVPEPSDIEALAGAIANWDSPEKRAEAAPRIRSLAARFSVEKNYAETLAILEKLL